MTPLNTDDQPDNMHFVDFFNIIGCKYFQLLLFLSLVCKSLCKKSKSRVTVKTMLTKLPVLRNSHSP